MPQQAQTPERNVYRQWQLLGKTTLSYSRLKTNAEIQPYR